MVNKKLPATLIVGAASTGKRALASRIIGRPLGPSDSCCSWTIDTAYYTAETKVVIRRPDGSKFGDLSCYDAVVLVFDAGSEASWAEVRDWAEAGHEQLGTAEVSLVVANKCDALAPLPGVPPPAPQRGHWLADAEDWCVSRRYEFVQAAAADERCDALLAAGDEGQGVARCVAALHAHMWPGLSLKERQRGGGGSGESIAAGSSEHGDGAGAGSREGNDAGVAASERAAASGAMPAGAASTEDLLEPMFGGGLVDALGGPGINGADGADGEEAEEEAAGERLDQLFGQLAAMRGQLDRVPDSQRREAASEMALRLAALLGLEEGESEGEEEGGEEVGEGHDANGSNATAQ